jgi:tRNA 2-selenouridine synthase
MTVRVLPVAEALAQYDRFDAVIDARSPAEFALDHLPDAQNWPVLDDAERALVGTEYKQVSALEARKQGASLVARRIADLFDRHLADKPREWTPLVYCWRGGQRSGTLAWFLDQVGFRVTLLQGGYKAFRAAVRGELAQLPERFTFQVVGGRTGSGKSRLLQALQAEGAQVLDLEALACHRGSVLGALPGTPQPSQKQFELRVWQTLRRFDPQRPVFVESESRKIGQLQVPEALILRMRSHGQLLLVDMPLARRVDLLLEDYAHFFGHVDAFCQLLQTMVELRGHERVSQWQALAREGRWAEVFEALVTEHYDPLYSRSMGQNYQGMAQATTLALADGQEKTLRETAQGLLGRFSDAAGC